MYLDNDGESPCSVLSTMMSQKARKWDAADICVKSEGNNWLIFYDKKSNKELNSHQMSKKRVGKPASYQYRGYRQPNPEPPQNPLIRPPEDNYTEFRARRRINGTPTRAESKREIPESFLHPKDESTRFFHGSNPKKNPFRVSTKIINDYRFQEAKLSKPQVRPPASARNVRSNYMDLYQRSLKPKKKSVWPPDNFYDDSPPK